MPGTTRSQQSPGRRSLLCDQNETDKNCQKRAAQKQEKRPSQAVTKKGRNFWEKTPREVLVS